MCLVDDGDGWKVFQSKMRRAAKKHKCCECQRRIEKGETYEYAAGLGYEHHWLVMRTCSHCLAAREWLRVVCGGWLMEGVLIDLEQHWDEEPLYCSLWLGRAIVGMRRRWRRRDGGLMPVLGPPPAMPTAA